MRKEEKLSACRLNSRELMRTMLPDLLKSLSLVVGFASFIILVLGSYYFNFTLWVPVTTLIGIAIAWVLNELSNWLETDQQQRLG